MSRTDEIKRALALLIEARRAELDAADDLSKLEVRLFFSPRCDRPREVEMQIGRKRSLLEDRRPA